MPVADTEASAIATLIAAGVAAVKAGDLASGRERLIQALLVDQTSATAWLWLSGAVANDGERRYCLERVLELDRSHAAAIRGLARLSPDVLAVSPLPQPEPVPDAAVTMAIPEPSGPLVAGRYELVTRRAGGMGVVHLCIDHQEQRPVALKTLRPEYLADRDARDCFLREGTTWVSLGQHPHIVAAFGVERLGAESEIFLALEWIVQPDDRPDAALRAWLEPGVALPVEQSLRFALHVARGMQYATRHLPALVHRDLKPENILVGRDGLARVTDFGLANTRPAKGGLGAFLRLSKPDQRSGGVAGTPLYMAPEQWTAGARLDARTDIYAFGCILYEMLAGAPAAPGESVDELKGAHQSGRLRPIPAGLSSDLTALVRRCLERKPERRYQSWDELETALTQIYQHEVGAELPAPVAEAQQHGGRKLAAGRALYQIGLSYHNIGRPAAAERYVEQALKLAQAESDRKLELDCLGNLGHFYLLRGDAARAEAHFQTYLALAQELGDRVAEWNALGDLACILNAADRWRDALGLYQHQLRVAQELDKPLLEALAWIKIADISANYGEPERARQLYAQALPRVSQAGHWPSVSHVLGRLARLVQMEGDLEQAIAYHQDAVQIAFEIGNRPVQAQALLSLGKTFLGLKDHQRAEKCLIEALAAAREAALARTELDALRSLGHAYRYGGRERQALGLYNQSIALARRLGDRSGEGSGLLGVALCQITLEGKKQAIKTLERCIELARSIDDRPGEGLASYNIGLLLIQLQRPGDARPYLMRAVDTLDGSIDWRTRQSAERLLTRVWNY